MEGIFDGELVGEVEGCLSLDGVFDGDLEIDGSLDSSFDRDFDGSTDGIFEVYLDGDWEESRDGCEDG